MKDQNEERETYLRIIRGWKLAWMMEDGYADRGMSVDSNMMHDLADRLVRGTVPVALAASGSEKK